MADDNKDVPFFTAVQVDQFRWPVKVPVPSKAEPGKYVYACFTGVFKYLTQAERAELEMSKKTDFELAREVLVGVEDLLGEDKQTVPSSQALIDKVLTVDRAAPTVYGTYMAVMRGLAPEKN